MSVDRLESTRARLRAWTRRPPERSAIAARTRVLAGLGDRKTSVRLLFGAAASAIAVLIVAVLLVDPRRPVDVADETALAAPPQAAHQPTVVYELSSGTTLYFTLTMMPARGAGGPGDGQGGTL